MNPLLKMASSRIVLRTGRRFCSTKKRVLVTTNMSEEEAQDVVSKAELRRANHGNLQVLMKTGAKMASEMQKIIRSMEISRHRLAHSLLSKDLVEISKAIEKASLVLMRPIPGEEGAPKDDAPAESSPPAPASSNAIVTGFDLESMILAKGITSVGNAFLRSIGDNPKWFMAAGNILVLTEHQLKAMFMGHIPQFVPVASPRELVSWLSIRVAAFLAFLIYIGLDRGWLAKALRSLYPQMNGLLKAMVLWMVQKYPEVTTVICLFTLERLCEDAQFAVNTALLARVKRLPEWPVRAYKDFEHVTN